MMNIRHLVAAILVLVQGIFQVLKSVDSFEALEEEVQRVVQRVAGMVLVWALERVDDQLMKQREAGVWECIGFRSRGSVSSFGEFSVRRRLYRNRKTGEYRFLLDEALGWGGKRRLTPRMEKLAVELSTEMPFRRAARIMNFLVPAVSPMSVWGVAKKAGERAVEEGRRERAKVFEEGQVPAGTKPISQLFLEADGVLIPQQRNVQRHDEVKLVTAYEGKRSLGGNRKELVNRRIIAGREDGEAIWEEASVVLGKTWDLTQVEEVHIGGDGASWVKVGVELFPNASFHLDPFHLRRRLTEALAHDEGHYEAVIEGLKELDREVTMRALEGAIRQSRGTRRKRVQKLKDYLLENWEGIAELPEEKRLGAIEGEIRHTIARRMKRIGARWTPGGTNRMARLLAARSNGELHRYVAWCWKADRDKLNQAVGVRPVESAPPRRKEDLGEWLRATVPALKGPFRAEPWIKYVLRVLTSTIPMTA